MADFAHAWADADDISGWLREAQARVLWDAAARVPAGGTIVEIGSHQGRSTVVLGAAAKSAGAKLVAIDPFVEGRMFGGQGTRARFEANVDAAGLRDVVRLVPRASTEVRPEWRDEIDLLYIDGKHDYWTVRDDLRWIRHLSKDSTVLVHDAFSSIGVTLGLLLHVLPGDAVRYVGRTGSLAQFATGRPMLADRTRIVRELPWWLRNIAIKIALRIARLFGRHSPDPY